MRNLLPKKLPKTDDKIVMRIHKHLIGLAYSYVLVFVAGAGSLGILFWGTNNLFDSIDSSLVILVAAGVAMVLSLMLGLMTIVYTANSLTLTNEEIQQILQTGLFSKKMSHLSLANVEDVTYEQNGFLPTLFNYGIVRIETAGEQANFTFTYCPRPEDCTRLVMDTREKYLETQPEVGQVVLR